MVYAIILFAVWLIYAINEVYHAKVYLKNIDSAGKKLIRECMGSIVSLPMVAITMWILWIIE